MNSEEFVKSIIEVVREESISDIIEDLVDPPGRKPSREDLELSRWFNQFSDKEKELLTQVVRRAVDTTIFGFFTVLDGVRAIESDTIKGKLQLYYKKNGELNLINNFHGEYLHDVFNNQTKE